MKLFPICVRRINACTFEDQGWLAFSRTTFLLFERQVLLFPLIIVVLACASFLFGGTCATWQWWTAVALVVLVPFARRSRWRQALGAAGFFALLLFALRCLIPPLVWDPAECPDMLNCHLPMVQLLIEGWNPVSDPLAERTTEYLGLDLWGMAPLHVAFSQKTLAIFSAVSHSFVRDPHALTFPLPVFLWLGVFLSAVRMFRGFSRWALVAALVFILPMVAWRMPVDLSMAFASCGLLLTMQNALRVEKCDWVGLAVWAVWMATLKLNGALGLVVFAAAFVIAKIRRERGSRKAFAVRCAAWATAVVLVAALISWNPLGTSWKRYGHPLYPYRTIDAVKFPVKDLAWDLKVGNDDLGKMNKIERFTHAYVHPRVAIAICRWRLGRSDFNPECCWWSFSEYPTQSVRNAIWLVFALLFAVRPGRLWAMTGLLLLFSMPNHMMGFTRYQPWLSALGCMAIAFSAEWLESRLCGQVSVQLKQATILALFFAGVVSVWHLASDITFKASECHMVRKWVCPTFLGAPPILHNAFRSIDGAAPRFNHLSCMENSLRLLLKESGKDGITVVVPAKTLVQDIQLEYEWDERIWFARTETPTNSIDSDPPPGTPDAWVLTPFGYWIPRDDNTKSIKVYYRGNHREKGEPLCHFISRNMCFFANSWLNHYPRAVLKQFSKSHEVRLDDSPFGRTTEEK